MTRATPGRSLVLQIKHQNRIELVTSPVTFQLRRPPLETSKYLFERHRRELARTSYSCLKKMLRRKVDEMIVKKSESSADRLNLQSRLAFLIELYQSLQKLKKGGVQGKDEGKSHLMEKKHTEMCIHMYVLFCH